MSMHVNHVDLTVEAEVRAAFDALIKASRALDAQAYLSFLDREKFTGLNADGTVWHSAQPLEELVVAGFQAVEKSEALVFDKVKVTVIDQSTAILVNEFKQTLLLKSGATESQAGGGSQVWKKSESGWKLVSISASDVQVRKDIF